MLLSSVQSITGIWSLLLLVLWPQLQAQPCGLRFSRDLDQKFQPLSPPGHYALCKSTATHP